MIYRGIQMAQIIDHAAGLGAFAGAEKAGHGDRGQERDDCDDDHKFDKRKAATATVKFVRCHWYQMQIPLLEQPRSQHAMTATAFLV